MVVYLFFWHSLIYARCVLRICLWVLCACLIQSLCVLCACIHTNADNNAKKARGYPFSDLSSAKFTSDAIVAVAVMVAANIAPNLDALAWDV